MAVGISMTSSDQTDIRKQVVDSRGLLKKIQLVVPGFRGYRELEDLRSADELLRRQVAIILQKGLSSLRDGRRKLVEQGDYTALEPVASLISRLQQLEGEVEHAEQGYSGISPMIRVGEDTLNSLYDYDFAFVDTASKLSDSCDLSSTAGGTPEMQGKIDDITSKLTDFKTAFEKRLEVVEKIQIK